MKVLSDIYLAFSNSRHKDDLLFSVKAGETGRGVRIHIKDTTPLEFKNIIKIDNKIFETPVTNITNTSFDIIFPSLKKGDYVGEIQILENEEIIKSGIYKISVEESLVYDEAEPLREINSDAILFRLSDAEESIEKKIKLMDEAIGQRAGLSAYQIWLNEGNTGTEQDFLNSLKGKAKDVNFLLDESGNLYVDID